MLDLVSSIMKEGWQPTVHNYLPWNCDVKHWGNGIANWKRLANTVVEHRQFRFLFTWSRSENISLSTCSFPLFTNFTSLQNMLLFQSIFLLWFSLCNDHISWMIPMCSLHLWSNGLVSCLAPFPLTPGCLGGYSMGLKILLILRIKQPRHLLH